VGAALRADDGRIFAGVNVENGAYPTGLCAERAAIAVAVAAGARRFTAIAIVTAPNRHGRPAAPCGQCRQALAEFGLDLEVILAGPEGAAETHALRALLPLAFTGEDL
jgi:cytidine deaminase